jgi:hypothetical protein
MQREKPREMTKAELLELLKNIDDSTKICIWADNAQHNSIRDPGGTYDILNIHSVYPHNNSVALEISHDYDIDPIFNKMIQLRAHEFLDHLRGVGSYNYIDIILNYAVISIEKVSSSASDRGNFIVKANHRAEFIDKCYIDEYDCFPRYYFYLNTLLSEMCAFIQKRNLEIEDIHLTCVNY